MEIDNKEVKIGQYWLANDGSILIITGIDDDDYFIVNKTDREGNFFVEISVIIEYLKKEVSNKVAKKIAIKYLAEKKLPSSF